MDVVAQVLRWAAIAGFAGWVALNVFVGYELLGKGASGRRVQRPSVAS